MQVDQQTIVGRNTENILNELYVWLWFYKEQWVSVLLLLLRVKVTYYSCFGWEESMFFNKNWDIYICWRSIVLTVFNQKQLTHIDNEYNVECHFRKQFLSPLLTGNKLFEPAKDIMLYWSNMIQIFYKIWILFETKIFL